VRVGAARLADMGFEEEAETVAGTGRGGADGLGCLRSVWHAWGYIKRARQTHGYHSYRARYAAKRAGYGVGEGNATFFCIVYDFIEGRDLSPQQILETSTFFHTLGFHLEPFNPDNWWGRGVLIDYGDIVPPVGGCWGFNERAYPRQLEWAEEKVYRLERTGLLTGPRSWPATAFRGRQEAHRSAGGRLGGERDGLAGIAMERERRGAGGGEGETGSEGR